jgi:hypothetical protein
VARRKVRSQNEVAARCAELAAEVRSALGRIDGGEADPGLVDAVWRGEALGTLLWALGRVELPPYDRPFDTAQVAAADAAGGTLRPDEELEAERATARLWHWRARTSALQARGGAELPAGYATFDQLIAATAMRGHERGLLPVPTRGDFHAYGRVYRQLTPTQRDEAHSIALERQHALEWLFRPGSSWDDVPLDT